MENDCQVKRELAEYSVNIKQTSKTTLYVALILGHNIFDRISAIFSLLIQLFSVLRDFFLSNFVFNRNCSLLDNFLLLLKIYYIPC